MSGSDNGDKAFAGRIFDFFGKEDVPLIYQDALEIWQRTPEFEPVTM